MSNDRVFFKSYAMELEGEALKLIKTKFGVELIEKWVKYSNSGKSSEKGPRTQYYVLYLTQYYDCIYWTHYYVLYLT